MRAVFQQELEDVQGRLVALAALVAAAMDRATAALAGPDVWDAEQVIAQDAEIDRRAAELDELIIVLLARQAPVARDLRVLVSALRISSSLERMGDLAEHIAQLTRSRFPAAVIPDVLQTTFDRMGALDGAMANRVVLLLSNGEVALADQVRQDDDRIDRLHAAVFDAVLAGTWKKTPASIIDVTLASRYHERFADHAVSIAAKVRYLATGDWSAARA